jgi:hypothetical protein
MCKPVDHLKIMVEVRGKCWGQGLHESDSFIRAFPLDCGVVGIAFNRLKRNVF